MHWLLFIHKILFSSTCFEPRLLIFRRIQLYTCSIWYCHSLWEFLVAWRYTTWVSPDWRWKVVGGCLKTPTTLWEFLVACRYTSWVLPQAVYLQATRNSHREWQCHRLHVYNCILLKMSTWGSKHVEENSILWINNQCIKIGNYYIVNSWFTVRKNIKIWKFVSVYRNLLKRSLLIF